MLSALGIVVGLLRIHSGSFLQHNPEVDASREWQSNARGTASFSVRNEQHLEQKRAATTLAKQNCQAEPASQSNTSTPTKSLEICVSACRRICRARIVILGGHNSLCRASLIIAVLDCSAF